MPGTPARPPARPVVPLCSPPHLVRTSNHAQNGAGRDSKAAPFNAPLPHGVLLYGPSGVGKSLLARAAAAEFNVAVLTLGATSLVRGEMGESERVLRGIFAKANSTGRAVIILDDMHVLFSSRSSVDSSVGRLLTSQLAMELDAAADGVVVVGTTSHPERIDTALLRAGRIDQLFHVPLPDLASRAAIVGGAAPANPEWGAGHGSHGGGELGLAGGLAQAIALDTEGFTGADIQFLVRSIVFHSARRARRGGGGSDRGRHAPAVGAGASTAMDGADGAPVGVADIHAVLSAAKRSVTADEANRLANWMAV